MTPQAWVPVVAFLLVSIPVVLLLNLLQWGGDFKVWIAIVFGVLASAYAQKRLQRRRSEP